MLLIDFDARFGSVPGLEAECITYPRPVSQAVGSEQLLILRCRLDPNGSVRPSGSREYLDPASR